MEERRTDAELICSSIDRLTVAITELAVKTKRLAASHPLSMDKYLSLLNQIKDGKI